MLQDFTKSALLAVASVQDRIAELVTPTQTPTTDVVDPAANLNYPGDNCCTIYAGHYWETPSAHLCLPSGKSSTTFDLNNYGMRNVMSSWICGDAVKYRWCTDTTGDCMGTRSFSGAGSAQTDQS